MSTRLPTLTLTESVREDVKMAAARRAYEAGLGASEWEALLTDHDRRVLKLVARADAAEMMAVKLRALLDNPSSQTAREAGVALLEYRKATAAPERSRRIAETDVVIARRMEGRELDRRVNAMTDSRE